MNNNSIDKSIREERRERVFNYLIYFEVGLLVLTLVLGILTQVALEPSRSIGLFCSLVYPILFMTQLWITYLYNAKTPYDKDGYIGAIIFFVITVGSIFLGAFAGLLWVSSNLSVLSAFLAYYPLVPLTFLGCSWLSNNVA